MRIPAIYRNQQSSDPIETIVWIAAWLVVPSVEFAGDRPVIKAVCIPSGGRPFEAHLKELEVIGWFDNDEALKGFRPPDYVPDTVKIRTLKSRRDANAPF